MNHSRRRATALLASATLSLATAGCLGVADAGRRTLKVAYPFWGEGDVVARQMAANAAAFERDHPGWRVQLIPIPDNGGNFTTKIELMQRSPASAPDVIMQDTVMTNADAEAGYLRPLDAHLRRWPQWRQFDDTARTAARAADGHLYGVVTGTDARGVFYDRRVFARAGLPTDWQPGTWRDILDAARAIKRRVPGVTPLNVYATRAIGEPTAMQSALMLLHGTGERLYREDEGVWSGNTRGLRQTLAFVHTVYREHLGPGRQDAANPALPNTVVSELLPSGRLGIALGEGSWSPKTWIEDGAAPWPEWSTHLGVAAMPTRDGSAPGRVTLSGGWMLAVSAHSDKADPAFAFVTQATSRTRAREFAIGNAQLPVRRDVATDRRYLAALPTNRFFTDLLAETRFRPAQADYPIVSGWLQIAMEAVMSGSATPRRAAAEFADGLRRDLGEEKVSSDE